MVLFTRIAPLFALLTAAALQAAPPRPNFLFIPVDDLNHWVGHLGRND